MRRRKFSREFGIEAVRLGVSRRSRGGLGAIPGLHLKNVRLRVRRLDSASQETHGQSGG